MNFIIVNTLILSLCAQPDGSLLTYRHEGELRPFILNKEPTRMKMWAECGPHTLGCIWWRFFIHVPDSPDCPRVLTHELNHLFGMDEIDEKQYLFERKI